MVMRIRNQRGQAAVETILLAAVFALVMQTGFKLLKNTNLFQKIAGDPWVKLKNGIHYGVFTDDKKRAVVMHPANFERHQTKDPKSP